MFEIFVESCQVTLEHSSKRNDCDVDDISLAVTDIIDRCLHVSFKMVYSRSKRIKMFFWLIIFPSSEQCYVVGTFAHVISIPAT